MDLSISSREDPFSPESIFAKQDLPIVPNDKPETYCRLCLTTPDVEPLFSSDGDSKIYVLDLIGKYIGIGINMQEDFPCAVCRPCQLILDQFDLFRQNCLKVDIAIRRKRLGLDQQSAAKNEPLDEMMDEDDESEMPYKRLENKEYQCRLCSETFRSITHFMAHCRGEHPEEARMYKCKYCTKAFMTKTARLQHIRSHNPNNSHDDLTGDRVQVCEKCMVTFDSYKLLKIHIKDHHSNDPKQEPLICSTCHRQFSRITILRNHILRVHLGKLPHVCKHCGISFGYAQQLLAHLKTEHGIVMPQPEQLNQSGQLYAEMESEQQDDSEIEPPAAIVCVKQELEEPKPQEDEPPVPSTDERRPQNKYTCTECRTQCSSPEELRNHRKIHQDPTWWKCGYCRNFVKHQKMHLLKKHPEIADDDQSGDTFEMRFRCWLCRVYFKSMNQLEIHAHVRHQLPLPEHLQSQELQQQVQELTAEKSAMSPNTPPGPLASTPQQLQQHQTPVQPPPPAPTMAGQSPLALPPSITPEQLPLLLSQLENGGWEYLREINRLIDPKALAALASKIKNETIDLPLPVPPITAPIDTSSSVMDLSGYSHSSSKNASALNLQTKEDAEPSDDDESEDEYYVRLDNRTYQCKLCPDTFRHLMLLRKHTKTQHSDEWKSVKCAQCKRRFPSSAIRDRHAHFHTLVHPFKCSACDQMYDSKKRMDQHYSSCHIVGANHFTLERFKCEICGLIFTEKKYYDLHTRVYHQRKPVRLTHLTNLRMQVCERCVITFDSKQEFMDHQKMIHHSDPPLQTFNCPKCGKDLRTSTLLRVHILVAHLGLLPYACQYCDSKFPSCKWLQKHVEKEHSQSEEIAPKPSNKSDTPSSAARPAKPIFKCPSCEDTFDDEELLGDHQDEVHALPQIEFDPETGKQLYPCTKCDKKLESKIILEKHLIKAHPTFMQMYKCPLCTKPIRYRKQHMRIHHDIEYDPKEHHYQVRYKCHCCSKLFQQKRNLVSHQNSLAYQCTRCQMRFKNKKSLVAHNIVHKHSRSLKCEDCGLEFGYRARL